MGMLPSSDGMVAGLLTGFVVGLLVGIVWRDAYCVIRNALIERRQRRKEGPKMHRKVLGKIELWMVVLAFAAVQTITGIGMIVQYRSMTAFIQCQADYNESSAASRSPRLRAEDKENDALFKFIQTIPPLLDNRQGEITKESLKERADFASTLLAALTAHQNREKIMSENPYENPTKNCGDL
jgi:hypothetical protein